ncbi:MAG: sialate O-acetylesterase [Sphingobacteriaceae bacterium]|nr:sialate O-acetylesterase [Sphingobacteriaceae bacterium]
MNNFRIFFKAIVLSFAALLFHITSFADIRLPAILGDHMVLQQKSSVKLWGWCDGDEKIKVSTNWDTVTYRAIGSSQAKWVLEIQTPKSGGPYTITIKGNNTVVLNDVLIGEVWACSGQSNMEMSYNWLQNWGSNLYTEDIRNSTNNNIRFFQIPKLTAAYPQDDTKGKWVVCTPAEAKSFSLVAYFFGQKLQQQLSSPLGLITASWGGTPAEVWTPKDIIESKATLADAAKKLSPSKWWTVTPGAAYNAMISPITNYNIAGALWYQGEANVSAAPSHYSDLLSSMIGSWRSAWKKDFPFYYVQIAPYADYGSQSALLREQQTMALSTPNTGMIVIHDLVDNIKDIHPRMKKEVGLRLADYALAETYGRKNFPAKSPAFSKMKVEKSKIRIYFDNAEKGLVSKGPLPTEFYIAGEDKVFKPAIAKIEGSTVVVSHPGLKSPVAVRFGFSNSAMPNIFSKEGLPANIFRTDNWDAINTVP